MTSSGTAVKLKFTMPRVFLLVLLLAALLTVPIMLSSCEKGEPAAKPDELEPVEVREYQGMKLSSVRDFEENSIKGPQHIDLKSYRLKITGLVKKPQENTYQEVIDSYRSYKKVVTLHCVEGWDATVLWEGLLVKDLLTKAEPLPQAKTVIFHAYDGYTTSLPIEYITENDIIMAYKMNQATLLPERGSPFQLVAESKWGYKWIRWITKIELSDNIDYKGYWEQRGYSNEANLNEDFFEK